MLEIKRFVGALDDFRCSVVTPNSLNQIVVRLAITFCDENIACSSQVPGRLAQRATGEQMLIAEGCLTIDQHNVEPMFQVKILQTVVEQKSVNVEFLQRMQPRLHPILVDHYCYSREIGSEHIRFVSGHRRV